MEHGSAAEEAADPLRSPPPAFQFEEARGIAEGLFGLSGSLSPLVSERDQNFRLEDASGRAFLLKISNPADDRAVIEMQTEALLHIERHDPSLPVMRVLPTADGAYWGEVEGPDRRTHLVRLFTFLEGKNAEATELDAEALRGFGSVTARLGRALRGFFHPAAGYEILWHVKHAPKLRPLLGHVEDAGWRAQVERVLDRFEQRVLPAFGDLRAQVIHNDMNLDNALLDERGRVTGITDFGDMTHTALVCDLAVAVADVVAARPDALDAAEHVIGGYVSVTPLEDEEASLLADLVATRLATAIVISAWRLRLYPENAEYISSWDAGARHFLELLQAVGLDEAGRRCREACTRGGLPYRPIPMEELLERRRNVLGLALSPLSYERPVHLVRGEGAWMFDPEGRAYLDAYNNVPVVGHCHPRVAAAIAEQARMLNTNTRYLHEAVVELAERLVATMPNGLDTVLFVNSGSEATDVAWRLARAAAGGRGAIVSAYAYHGVTTATADFSPEEWREGERPEHVATVPAPDGYRGRYCREEEGWAERYAAHVGEAVAVLEARGMQLAAMFVDSAFTSDGILVPPPPYLQEVARRVHEAGGLLVADEVQAGHGRYGKHLWSFQASGIEPDFVTLGKPMGNGHPVAAVVTRSDIVDRFARKTEFFSTFGGNPVACAAGLAVLQVIEEEGLQGHAAEVGAYLLKGLEELMERHALIGDVRGAGLLVGVELVRDRGTREPASHEAKAVMNGMREQGVLIGSTGPDGNVLKIRPPLVFTQAHADLLLETLEKVVGEGG